MGRLKGVVFTTVERVPGSTVAHYSNARHLYLDLLEWWVSACLCEIFDTAAASSKRDVSKGRKIVIAVHFSVLMREFFPLKLEKFSITPPIRRTNFKTKRNAQQENFFYCTVRQRKVQSANAQTPTGRRVFRTFVFNDTWPSRFLSCEGNNAPLSAASRTQRHQPRNALKIFIAFRKKNNKVPSSCSWHIVPQRSFVYCSIRDPR